MTRARRSGAWKFAGTLLAATAPAWVAAAEAPGVAALPAKSEVKVGEVISVELKASGPAGTVWTFPEQAGSDSVEIRRAAPVAGGASASPGTSEEDGAASPADVERYDVAVFALDNVELPAIPVRYRLPDGGEGEVATSPVPLRIVSVLPKEPGEPKLADIRGPQALSIGRVFWIGAAVFALLIVALGVWWRRRPRRGVSPLEPPVNELAPDAEAREALDRLAASGVLARGAYRPFYIALTEIAKRYLERRLEAPVLEMTSSEMLAFLRDHAHGRAFVAAMRDLAAAADPVKFAGDSGRGEEAERHLAGVREMVEALEARLRPRTTEPQAERVA